jgi:sulfur-oxidizing protein SoxY
MVMKVMPSLSRRETLVGSLAAFITFVEIDPSSATPAEAAAEIAKFTGGKAATPGNITIDLPEIAENGNTVPLMVSIDSPMTAGDRITEILVATDGNPRPGVAIFHFTEMSGRAMAATRIRLAATENVIVVARTSTGKLLTAAKQVKVTIGGCGG